MKDVLLFHLSIILVDESLHAIKDYRLIQVRSASRVVDDDIYPDIPGHQRINLFALQLKVALVTTSLRGLDERRPSV
jgi:hypothetical protein